MAYFGARTLGIVRRNVNRTLKERCTIQRETHTKGTMGEPLHEFEQVAADVACRVITAGERNRTAVMDVGSQESLVERYRLICPVGTLFEVDNRVVMSDGRVFQIVDVEDGLTDEAYAGAIMIRVRV